jgi:PBP1b-binding outer membrane lipoprotein LpoB
MKPFLFLALALLTAGCSAEGAKPDPRVATIHQQHEQLLTQQKQYVALLPTLTGSEKLSPGTCKGLMEFLSA